MEKENKLTAEQETKENEIVELKDEDLKNVSAGDVLASSPKPIKRDCSLREDGSGNCSTLYCIEDELGNPSDCYYM
ncbi:MAG: hypothetical protein MJ247_01285 [Alphaproteobacteria bacterium]|nr:hypothetical protein [Alphaproteobacteria bacterium]